jgi:murein DD-endopeptidase MepM/ murein hydrolase activator NlpD
VRILTCSLLIAFAFSFQPLQPTTQPANAQVATAMPTSTFELLPTWTLTPQPTLPPVMLFSTNTPQPSPSATFTPSATPTNLPTLPPINSPTPLTTIDPSGTPLPTWTPPPPDPASQIADHYRLFRPIGQNNVNYADRTYPYGGNSGGALQVHHGIDLANGVGTPILAAGDGVVYYAGSDLSTLFGPTPDYYGNLVVIQHNFNSPEGQPVFSLYGHMSEVSVQTGQAVSAGDVIGAVGATGVAFGPHLHFEVRVGDPHDFGSTRNPDLWLYPYQNFGTLAGRVTDASGTPLYSAPVQIRSAIRRYTYTYPDNSVNGDPTFRENFTYGDLPANYYEVSVNDGNRVRFQKIIYVYPNQTTWIDIVLN